MESYSFHNVNFTYPESKKPALNSISFSVNKGEFVILCGPSGCGKTTLLRHLKTCLTPHGILSGEIWFEENLLSQIPIRDQAQKIGYVLQSPDNQVVTDKVWHELAFGLESLGYGTQTIRRRVAEIAAFFGIEGWFYKNITELSGGQKQLLSLASIMAMQPSVLVLDEPTSQLDPIAASDFLALLGKINRELGTTIILTEHRLEEAFPFATRVIVMKKGRIFCDGTPEQVGLNLKRQNDGMFLAMPTAMRVWAALNTKLACPITVRDGSVFLSERAIEQPLLPLSEKLMPRYPDELVLEAEELWFRYEKDSSDVLKGFSLKLKKGEFYSIMGGNGAGKTTVLKVISGLRRPYRGEIRVNGKIGLLPQNPQALFVKRTVREDLYEVFRGQKISKDEQDRQVAWAVQLCQLSEFLDRHPYDISGGEQQRTALAKVLLTAPDILLLDEPTKGFDAEFKVAFAGILKKLNAGGVTILMVSHDVSFCAEYAHKCGLYFDGQIVAHGVPTEFFSGNSFYTTPANRMARHMVPKAITIEDIISVGGGVLPEKDQSVVEIVPLPNPEKESVNYVPKPLPVCRKCIAAVCAAIAFGIFFYATNITDLSKLVGMGGITAEAKDYLWLYAILICACIGFILATWHRSAPSTMDQMPTHKRKLRKRTVVSAIMILLFVPLTIFVGVFYLNGSYYNVVALLVLFECMIPFFLVFESRKPQARELVTIAILCAIGVASRGAFFMLPQFKPVMALTIITGVAFGGETGFLVGAMTMLASNVLFGQGPWSPWQMFSMGIIGFLAGILFRKGWLRRSTGSLVAFGGISAIVIYGGIMNFASAIMWGPQTLNRNIILSYYVTGLPMDLIHAVATVIFLALAAQPMLEKLDRIKSKYGLIE